MYHLSCKSFIAPLRPSVVSPLRPVAPLPLARLPHLSPLRSQVRAQQPRGPALTEVGPTGARGLGEEGRGKPGS